MPKRYPPEFKRDVVAVARTSGLTHAQIAEDFGISEHSVQRWLKQADIDDGVVEGTTTTEQDELVALQAPQPGARAGGRDPASGDRVLRQGRGPKMTYPLVRDLADDGIPVTVTCRVLGFSTQGFYKWRANPVSSTRLGRRAPDQRDHRHPRRRSGVRLPVHRRRAARRRPPGVGEPGAAAVCAAEDRLEHPAQAARAARRPVRRSTTTTSTGSSTPTGSTRSG
jgi:hypothetical protein